MTNIENKYRRKLRPIDIARGWIDGYAVNTAYSDNSEIMKHIIKKALAAGTRGSKDYKQDVTEIRNQAILELEEIEFAEKLETTEVPEQPKITDYGQESYPAVTTHFQEYKSGGYGFYQVTDSGVFEFNDHTKVWRKHVIDSAHGVRIAIQNREIKPISKFYVTDVPVKTNLGKEPGFININGYEVPEPVREPLEIGEDYYVANTGLICTDNPQSSRWRDDLYDNRRLENGVIHKTLDSAIAHIKALLSFTKIEEGES